MRRSTDVIALAKTAVIRVYPAGIPTHGGVPAAQAANMDQGFLRCQMPDLAFTGSAAEAALAGHFNRRQQRGRNSVDRVLQPLACSARLDGRLWQSESGIPFPKKVR